MASKGPRSKLDHDIRAKRQKALEAPKEPRRRKTHWDHVLEEMVWLSKDFESERKWKLAHAKKVALRASKGMLDQATRGEKKVKEEEHKLRKVALIISKDVKKFWLKIEKLVLYKHQMELEVKKKKALDKQLEYLLGQTERYSTMLAENLVENDKPSQLRIEYKEEDKIGIREQTEINVDPQADFPEMDEDYDLLSEDDLEDDEHTIEEDEALVTEEERQKELAALRDDIDVPLEELLKRYVEKKVSVSRESSPKNDEDDATEPTEVQIDPCEVKDVLSKSKQMEKDHSQVKNDISDVCLDVPSDSFDVPSHRSDECNGTLSIPGNHLEVGVTQSRSLSKFPKALNGHMLYDFGDEQEDGDFIANAGDTKDDEATMSEEEEMAKAETNDPIDEIALLQKESELSLEELLARYQKDMDADDFSEDGSEYTSSCSDLLNSPSCEVNELQDQAITVEADEHGELEPVVQSQDEEHEEEPGKKSEEEKESEIRIADAAAAARSAQPTGNTFSTTKVRTKFPFLLKHPLREYQHIGLDWLVAMYEKKLNGILADEMGLGKTIMTIALLAHLACEKGIWGPHLIVVPTSVMLNWETEFLRWCPAFKILTYYGNAKERKFKRQGWLKPNSFHICITTYRLVIQDSKIFKRKKWKYLILDEAHLIKNWKSQRWQTLLNFNSKRRILLTGTPLQNDLMELWSLMHFLMPHIFQSHQEFKDWFSNPITGMVEGQEKVNKEVIDRLHNVLRPFILRRLKRDVEKQLPMKVEHVIYCRLSRRQRNLYEDFIASSETQATLSSSNFFGMISVIMQLRKVCNHPDLFEGRPIISSFDMAGVDIQLSSSVCSMLSPVPSSKVDLVGLGFLFTHLDFSMTSWEADEVKAIATPSSLIRERDSLNDLVEIGFKSKSRKNLPGTNIFEEIHVAILKERLRQAKERAKSIAWWNSLRCRKRPMYSTTLQDLVTVKHPVYDIHCQTLNPISYLYSSKLANIILSPVERFRKMIDKVESFMFAIPAARAPQPVCWCSKAETNVFLHPNYMEKCSEMLLPLLSPIRPAIIRRQVYFPDRRLIQFDCGKLQELAILLRRLKSEGHRALIFTQMTKVLDILEAFINLYGYTYMRLDGSTLPEERQTLMQRFNTNPKIFLFILSTRSGGVGINLVGADTVIFYDSDWNPAMDQQAQDRCHRIGQTREVHIYRLISESTIEENILKKANQKRALDDLVIQGGGYNTDFFKKLDPMELFSGHKTLSNKSTQKEKNSNEATDVAVSNAEVEAALKFAEDEADYMALKKLEQEEAVENQEFTEEAIGRMEDDELVNEDDVKADHSTDHGACSNSIKDTSHTVGSRDDDIDMLADVKLMAAAAAAAGQAISSFENHLRPIDRYAIRYMELWDPIVDKAALEHQNKFEETEWELDRIERLKEDMEAEMDEDDEPLVYESWDAEFATEAYRQQVETLAQHQLIEDLECEAKEKEKEKEEADNEIYDSMKKDMLADRKPKSKKKKKKTKFKSLKKRSLAPTSKIVKEEPLVEAMSTDDEFISHGITAANVVSLHMEKKRKKFEAAQEYEEEVFKKRKANKVNRGPPVCTLSSNSNLSDELHEDFKELKPCDKMVVENEPKLAPRGKMAGKISITAMTVKRVLMIKPEKLNKKGNIWSKDYFPSPDPWLIQEDAVLCAVVHEYGPHWSLVSETLYGMTTGGFYRGRFRHPVHCCERYRELIQKYVLSTADGLHNEKVNNAGSGKALLKVTEDNIRMLLDMASEMPDRELLIQMHFTALLSSVWRVSPPCQSNQKIPSPGGRLFGVNIRQISQNSNNKPPQRIQMKNLNQSSKLLAAALSDTSWSLHGDPTVLSANTEEVSSIPEQLDITLQFQGLEDDCMNSSQSFIKLSLYGSDSPHSVKKSAVKDRHLRNSVVAENRFRAASRTCFEEGNLAWASTAFPAGDFKSRLAPKSLSIGKHKLSFSDSTKSSKSKFKRTIEHGEIHPGAEPMFHSVSRITSINPDLRSDFAPDVEIRNSSHNCYPFCLEHEFSMDSDISEPAFHHYLPGFIAGLDDYSSECRDIG